MLKKIEDEIYLIEDFLSQEEVQQFVSALNMDEFSEAKVQIDGKQTMFKSIRNNERIMFKNKELASAIFEKFISYVSETDHFKQVIGCNDMIRIYKYSEGQRFKMHRDGSYKIDDLLSTKYSFLVYLNDDFIGGETKFKEYGLIKPKKGMALIFKHEIKHEGALVEKGKKLVLRTDLIIEK